MRVLHVSTYRTGGAGIAAFRLHKGLLALGVASEFLYLNHETAGVLRKPAPPTPPPLPLYRRILSKIINKAIHSSTVKQVAAISAENEVNGNYEAFTSPITDFDITQHPAYEVADVVHLHWVADLLDYPSFFAKNKKPVVWTLHDMNPLQGGFHYMGDATENAHLAALELEYLQIKEKALSSAHNISVVALSRWLQRISANNSILKGFAHRLIPNGVDKDIFKPLNKGFAREALGLPAAKTIVLFVSERLSVRRKGFNLIQEVIGRFSHQDQVLFCAVGMQDTPPQPNTVYLDAIRDERLMAVVYTACDVFILPSREDNLPNVMLEALACGTPVIATPVGGIPDVVIPDFNGLLSQNTTADTLYEALQLFLSSQSLFNSALIREDFLKKYTIEKQASAFLELYSEVL
jgi:glycosyltransferase involved in cell wall biosynthesis